MMDEYDLTKLVNGIEKSLRLRFLASIVIMALAVLSLAFVFYRHIMIDGNDLAEFYQILGTTFIGVGIAVGLLATKASASITMPSFSDDRILALNKRYGKKLTVMNEFSVLLTLLGTLVSGYSVIL